MVLDVILLITVLIVGPTLLILNMYTETLGLYIQDLIKMSLRTAPLEGDNRGWLDSWTLFYWPWWIAWAPFGGMSIARVSPGRPIRSVMTPLIPVPTL